MMGPDLILFSMSRFDDPISAVGFSYAKEFAKHHRVFFIEHPFTWKEYYAGSDLPAVQKRKKIWSVPGAKYLEDAAIPKEIRYVVPPRMIPVNFLGDGPIYNALSRLNDRKMFAMLQELIQENDIRDFVFFNIFDPFYMLDFPASIKPRFKAYLCLDDMSQVAYTARHGVRREGELISKWDFSFATGSQLCKLKSVHGTVYHLPNASDLELFRTAYEQVLPMPEEFKDFRGKKIIGFTGSVEYRMDFGLLKKTAERHRDKVLMIIGPVYADEIKEMGIDMMDNVKLLGPRHITELPSYLQYMDVMVIPFRLSELNKSIYPLKVNEYLGAGKPVVSTHFSEDIYNFRDVVYVAESHDAFINLIDTAIAEDNKEKRKARFQTAAQNTWSERVQTFWQLTTNN